MNSSYDYSYQTSEISTNRKIIYEKHAPEGCTIAYFYESALPSRASYQSSYNCNNNSVKHNSTHSSYKSFSRHGIFSPDNA